MEIVRGAKTVHRHIHRHTHTQTQTHRQTHTRTRARARAHAHTHTHTQTQTHRHTHTHTHTETHFISVVSLRKFINKTKNWQFLNEKRWDFGLISQQLLLLSIVGGRIDGTRKLCSLVDKLHVTQSVGWNVIIWHYDVMSIQQPITDTHFIEYSATLFICFFFSREQQYCFSTPLIRAPFWLKSPPIIKMALNYYR